MGWIGRVGPFLLLTSIWPEDRLGPAMFLGLNPFLIFSFIFLFSYSLSLTPRSHMSACPSSLLQAVSACHHSGIRCGNLLIRCGSLACGPECVCTTSALNALGGMPRGLVHAMPVTSRRGRGDDMMSGTVARRVRASGPLKPSLWSRSVLLRSHASPARWVCSGGASTRGGSARG